MGLAAAQLGKALGANPIIGIDLAPSRRQLSQELGLTDYVFDANDGAPGQIKDVTKGHGCEVAIDCSGAASARLQASVTMTRLQRTDPASIART